jgi:hypothetical protein
MELELYYIIAKSTEGFKTYSTYAISKKNASDLMDVKGIRVVAKQDIERLKKVLRSNPILLNEVDKYILKNIVKSKSKYLN